MTHAISASAGIVPMDAKLPFHFQPRWHHVLFGPLGSRTQIIIFQRKWYLCVGPHVPAMYRVNRITSSAGRRRSFFYDMFKAKPFRI
jgi:hypothetical protein